MDDATRANLVVAWERTATLAPGTLRPADRPHTGPGGLGADAAASPALAAVGAGDAGGRVVALHALLGARSDLDAPGLAARTPALLTLTPADAAARVIAMKAAGVPGADVGSLIAARPALLLQPPPVSPEPPAARLAAWKAGLAGDGDAEWAARRNELASYVATHGDAAVGARSGDTSAGDPPGLLVRWVARQRAAAKTGELAADRRAALEALGFEFSEEAAEWNRWAAAARAQAAQPASGVPGALVASAGGGFGSAGDGLALENWKSVQRVARRAGVLSAERVAALDEWGFDWTGADALS